MGTRAPRGWRWSALVSGICADRTKSASASACFRSGLEVDSCVSQRLLILGRSQGVVKSGSLSSHFVDSRRARAACLGIRFALLALTVLVRSIATRLSPARISGINGRALGCSVVGGVGELSCCGQRKWCQRGRVAPARRGLCIVRLRCLSLSMPPATLAARSRSQPVSIRITSLTLMSGCLR
jgi:hypothetical protein